MSLLSITDWLGTVLGKMGDSVLPDFVKRSGRELVRIIMLRVKGNEEMKIGLEFNIVWKITSGK